MTQSRIILLVFAALAILILGVTIYNLQTMQFGACSNDVVETAASPEGDYEAIVFTRSCEGVDGSSVHVSIIESGSELPNDFGNAAYARGEPEDAVAGLNWRSDGALVIVTAPGASLTLNGESNLPVEVSLSARRSEP